MQTPSTQTTQGKPEASDAGRYFRHMAEFVGFTESDAEVIRETRFIIEKHIPAIVGKFYAHLLEYPPMRKNFLKKDGSIDQEYLQLRMHHLTNFWRRTASGVFDDDYANYVDYVGRAHTSQGADPKIYIPERYVIGQVGFIQHAIGEALQEDLHEFDTEFETRALKAWNLLMMVILELLARSYSDEHEVDGEPSYVSIEREKVEQLAIDTYERNLGLYRTIEYRDVIVARADEIAEGDRKIVDIDGLSIGVFHHKGSWVAVRNFCLHRAGPVCTGSLDGDTLTCPWHGYQYNLTSGQFLRDPSVKLEMYEVQVRDGDIHLQIPSMTWDTEPVTFDEKQDEPPELGEAQFRVHDIQPGQMKLVELNGQRVVIYNVDGEFYATQDECTHAQGPLSEGELEGDCIVCPWHKSRFDVKDGSVLKGPATAVLKTYRVLIEGETGRVEQD